MDRQSLILVSLIGFILIALFLVNPSVPVEVHPCPEISDDNSLSR